MYWLYQLAAHIMNVYEWYYHILERWRSVYLQMSSLMLGDSDWLSMFYSLLDNNKKKNSKSDSNQIVPLWTLQLWSEIRTIIKNVLLQLSLFLLFLMWTAILTEKLCSDEF